MTTPIDPAIDLASPKGWNKLLGWPEDSDEAAACAAFAAFLASKGIKISKIDQVPTTPPPSSELITTGTLALKRATEVQKRPLASLENIEEEITAAKHGSKRQKSKESSLVILDRILVAFQNGQHLDRFDAPNGSGMQKAMTQAAKRALNVNKLPEDIIFTNCSLGDEGWLATAGVPQNKRKYFSATIARLSMAVKDRLHTTYAPGACKELYIAWREDDKVKHATVSVFTGNAIQIRSQLCKELTAAQVSQIRYCKTCQKLSWTFCACTLPMP